MPIHITTDLITIVSTLFGVVSLLVAVYQTVTARKAKRIYENHCRAKCKDIVGLTRAMTGEVLDCCELLGRELRANDATASFKGEKGAYLVAKINGIRLLTDRLASFCDSINDDHKEQFGKPVFECIDRELPQRECLQVMRDFSAYVPGSDPSDARARANERFQADRPSASLQANR